MQSTYGSRLMKTQLPKYQQFRTFSCGIIITENLELWNSLQMAYNAHKIHFSDGNHSLINSKVELEVNMGLAYISLMIKTVKALQTFMNLQKTVDDIFLLQSIRTRGKNDTII